MKRIFFVLGVVLTLVLILGLFFMKVRSVSCSAKNGAVCPPTTTDKLNAYRDARLFQVEKKLRTMLSSEPVVSSYSVKTSPLGDIQVFLTLREGSIALKPDSSETFTEYTKDGILVRETNKTELPTVILKEQVSTDSLPFIATFAYQLTTILPISQMTVEGQSLKVVLRDARTLYYPLSGDIDLLLGTTLITFSQLNLTDGKLIIDRQAVTIREIDFRFKNPVLR